MSNIAGALYRVTKIKNEMKCSRRMRLVSRQCQFKQPCLQVALEGKKWRCVPDSWRETVPGVCSCHGKCAVAERLVDPTTRVGQSADRSWRRVPTVEVNLRSVACLLHQLGSGPRPHRLDSVSSMCKCQYSHFPWSSVPLCTVALWRDVNFREIFSRVDNLNSRELDWVSMGISALRIRIPKKNYCRHCVELVSVWWVAIYSSPPCTVWASRWVKCLDKCAVQVSWSTRHMQQHWWPSFVITSQSMSSHYGWLLEMCTVSIKPDRKTAHTTTAQINSDNWVSRITVRQRRRPTHHKKVTFFGHVCSMINHVLGGYEISSGRHLTKKSIYKATVCFYICLCIIWCNYL